jgi:hypothetical protein
MTRIAVLLSMYANFKQFVPWINIITSLSATDKGMKFQQLHNCISGFVSYFIVQNSVQCYKQSR